MIGCQLSVTCDRVVGAIPCGCPKKKEGEKVGR